MSVDVKNVFYTYGKKTPYENLALKDVSLSINSGDFVALIGATGSGKSTLIQHLNGLLIPEQGEILVDEFKVTNQKKKNKHLHELRKKVGLVFQFPEYQLFEETVEKDVAFGPKNFGLKDNEALEVAHEALNSVGLDESYFKRSPFELSGGEKRRVAIAGILALHPDILVLDEPTASLDPKGSKEIMSLVSKMNKNGTTIILVTHDMDLVIKYASKCFVLKHGELIFQGNPRTLFSSLDESSKVEIPELYKLVNLLNKKGKNIDPTKVYDIDTFLDEVLKSE